MAIKKAKYNYDADGAGNFDTYHYETQLGQVKKVDANGAVVGDLSQELSRIDTDIDTVDAKVDNANLDINQLETQVGNVSSLSTTAKNVVPAINEVKTKVDNNASNIDGLGARMTEAENDIIGHKHDNLYLKLSGGSLSDKVSMANNKSFAGKNNSGVDFNIGKVDSSNQVVLGDVGGKAIIQSSGGDLRVSDGSNSYKVFHAGNMGAGSGLDADTIDGVDSNALARVNSDNYFKGHQNIQDSKNLVLKASSGSSQAGSFIFQDGLGGQKAKLSADVNGNLALYGGNIKGLTVGSDGITKTEYGLFLNAKDREVSMRFQKDDSDAGVGFYLNGQSNRIGLYDWQSSKFLFTTDRANGMVEFTNAIKVQGKRVYVQSSAPTYAEVGDVWFAI